MQISIVDEYKKRPIKRGKPKERGARPNSRKFIDSSFLPNINEKGEFKPINTQGGSDVEWLGFEYYKSIGEKPYTLETVIQGILNEQAIWNPSVNNVSPKFNRNSLLKK